jgi:hypothetical protein
VVVELQRNRRRLQVAEQAQKQLREAHAWEMNAARQEVNAARLQLAAGEQEQRSREQKLARETLLRETMEEALNVERKLRLTVDVDREGLRARHAALEKQYQAALWERQEAAKQRMEMEARAVAEMECFRTELRAARDPGERVRGMREEEMRAWEEALGAERERRRMIEVMEQEQRREVEMMEWKERAREEAREEARRDAREEALTEAREEMRREMDARVRAAVEATKEETKTAHETERECPVCMERPKDSVFNCGHQTCQICAASLRLCPECRTPIKSRTRVYGGAGGGQL